MRDVIKWLAQPLAEYKTDALKVYNAAIREPIWLTAWLHSIHALKTNESKISRISGGTLLYIQK